MDVRRATEMLCRSYASLSLSASASRATLPSRRDVATRIAISPRCQSRRQLSTQASLRQEAAPRKPDTGSDYNASSPDMRDMYKSRRTFLGERNPNGSSARFDTPSSFRPQQPRTTIPTPQRTTSPPRTSVDDILDEAQQAQKGPRGTTYQSIGGERASDWVTPRRSSFPAPNTKSRYAASDLSFPENSELRPSAPRPRVITELDIHVKPRTGRSVAVDPQKPNDLGSKLRALEILCARNRVKQDFNQQRFHERPGLRRKRLASQRWRKNFRTRFNGVVARVNDLRVQGW